MVTRKDYEAKLDELDRIWYAMSDADRAETDPGRANELAGIRSLVKRTCHTPLLVAGSFAPIDDEQKAEGLREQIATAEEMLKALGHHVELLDMANQYLKSRQNHVMAIRDDARAASARDLEARRSAWVDGVQACIDMVKRRHEHYELYQCDCGAEPEAAHKSGCKAEMMRTHPATLVTLDEMFVFLSALKLRGPS